MITVKQAASQLGQSVESIRLALSAIRSDWDACKTIEDHEFEELSKLLQPPALPQQSQQSELQPTLPSQPTQPTQPTQPSQPTQPTALEFFHRSLAEEIQLIEAATTLRNRLAMEILQNSDLQLAEALNVRHIEAKTAYLAVFGDLASLKPCEVSITPDTINLSDELKKFQ